MFNKLSAQRNPLSSTGKGAVSARGVNYATSPLLASKTPPWRSRFIVIMVALGFAVLAGRAVYVQMLHSDFYVKQGEKRYARHFALPASRGRILDRNGAVLATSIPAPSIWAIPRDFEASVAQRKALSKLLDMTPAELKDRTDGDNEFAWLRRQVDEAQWDQIKALKVAGVHQVREFKRKYPEGEAAAHVVGFTTVEELGIEGIERSFHEQLQGRPGARGVVKDRLGQVVEDIGERVEPVDGQDVTLSIDSKVQFFAWQKLRDAVRQSAAQAGSVVVLDARTGEVLALANYPSFDPAQRYPKGSPLLRNRALTDIFEPGSTMKPFIAAWALETKRVTPQTVLSTQPFQVTGTTIKDDHPHDHLTVTGVIQKSSNVGTVRMAQQMDRKEMWELMSSVGFGQRPELDFPGVVTGRLRPYKTWRPVEQATMSYGYGVSTSLLQLARAYTVFARDGDLVPLTLKKQDGPVAGQRVVSAKTAQEVRHMLNLVTLPGGTAPKAQTSGFSVGGKTGTARKHAGREYLANKYRAWFVGLAPANDPRIVVAVMVDEPSKGSFYGGEVAAPVFADVVQQTLRTLGVAPDIPVVAQIVIKPGDTAVESY